MIDAATRTELLKKRRNFKGQTRLRQRELGHHKAIATNHARSLARGASADTMHKHGMSYQAIADALGISKEGARRAHLNYLRELDK